MEQVLSCDLDAIVMVLCQLTIQNFPIWPKDLADLFTQQAHDVEMTSY